MSKHNAAKKTPVIPTIGTILVVHNDAIAKKTGPAKVVSIDHEHGNIKIYRPGSRTPWNVIKFSSLRSYWYTDESKFPGIDFNEANGGLSTLTNTEPSQSKANDEEPKSEPPPPPNNGETGWQFADNGTAIIHLVEKISERMEVRFQHQLETQEARFMAILNTVLDRADKRAVEPIKTKEEEREEATNKQVKEEMPWAEPQLWRFIDETMEFVTFATQSERERALRPGEVFDQFSLWCEVNGLRVPFQKTVFCALLKDDRTRPRWKLNGKEEKTPLAIRRQTRFGFDESGPIGKDVQDIVAHARKTAWPALPETYRETIAKLLLDKVSKADIFTALNHIAAMPRRGEGAYTPDKVLVAKHIRALVKIASAEGPAK